MCTCYQYNVFVLHGYIVHRCQWILNWPRIKTSLALILSVFSSLAFSPSFRPLCFSRIHNERDGKCVLSHIISCKRESRGRMWVFFFFRHCTLVEFVCIDNTENDQVIVQTDRHRKCTIWHWSTQNCVQRDRDGNKRERDRCKHEQMLEKEYKYGKGNRETKYERKLDRETYQNN